MRMLPAATLQATRSPTKPVGAQKISRKKTDLAACNTLVSQPVRFFGFLKSVRVCALYRLAAPARKTAVTITFDQHGSHRLRDTL